MTDIETLIDQISQEAQREPFPIDVPVYEAAHKNPNDAILYAGNLKSQICFFGRDLGRDEVHEGQPLIGAAGTLVRKGFYRSINKQEAPNKEALQTICDRALLTNTVPYKPPGNKAYSKEVKERFRPFIEQLLIIHWKGTEIITLGTEAFKWFTPYCSKIEINSFWEQSDRYSSKLPLILKATDSLGEKYERKINLLPLPHPSPLNTQYYAKFPQMLQKRLIEF
ncbi:uracil-DNA glycosylase family protein [Aphanothece sacrum]|uniref:Uracil-DNA glycosylase n=1 Tax=Aphanothece sacrum FPU1 TaxID=1920663 RepID=A0A401IEK0_APHSA|nr:uracil-DNA glycosylase family protein [Aphanothece sacrum]GBF79656.1 uracil-DNA glycosylase [Aphanothece sacrum FPU1]GBF87116.1 uracil-DNA glycosylase superfamily [Aphanothece sacrum FPU3]